MLFSATCSYDAHGMGRTVNRIDTQAVGVGKCGFFTRYGTHPHPLFDLETAGFDDSLFQMPAFKCGMLAINIGIINLAAADDTQAACEQLRRQVIGFEQVVSDGWIGLLHGFRRPLD